MPNYEIVNAVAELGNELHKINLICGIDIIIALNVTPKRRKGKFPNPESSLFTMNSNSSKLCRYKAVLSRLIHPLHTITDRQWKPTPDQHKLKGFRLGWVKAHIGIKGNEIADTLAKEATTHGIPASLPFPKSFLKKQLLQLSLSHWQAEWDSGETGRSVYSYFLTNRCTGPENASNSPLAMGLPQLPQDIRSPIYRLLRMWGNRKSPSLCNEMSTYFILSPQGTKPTIGVRAPYLENSQDEI
ncbi:hypothetical protein AVEN_52580-1 [Araneus ventricosus]|uniref:Uncharacterized protein n=1 Tax=Araneus ventricosus TaxID=182803 RepID=A0A4Y2NZ95_ARAVE|nr:hypothetical protein AVEN_52580-1 [Araneus ventricosus]